MKLTGLVMTTIALVLVVVNCGGSRLPSEVEQLVGNRLPGGATMEAFQERQAFEEKYGKPETLTGTDNQRWIVYFPKGDFTVIVSKADNTVQNVRQGRRAQ